MYFAAVPAGALAKLFRLLQRNIQVLLLARAEDAEVATS